jgi:hypothetical protein
MASRASVHGAGHGDRYEAALDAAARDAVAEIGVVGVWLPLNIALAHYRACDSLGLGANAIAAIGRSTNDKVKGSVYGTFIRAFKEAGLTPWAVIPQFQRFWDRTYEGGCLRVTKLGPKEARVDVINCALCQSHYWRHALRGLSCGLIELVCSRAYATELVNSPDSLSYRYQWA